MSNRTEGLFHELLEGARALERMPELEAKVINAEADKFRAQADADFQRTRYANLAAEYDAKVARIAELEADLAQATKSSETAKGDLKAIVDLVKGISTQVTQVVELAEPPAPQPDSIDPFGSTGPISPQDLASGGESEVPPTFATSVEAPPKPVEIQSAPSDASTTTPSEPEWATPTVTEVTPEPVKPYWNKPDYVSWKDWQSQGGGLAPWIREKDMSLCA